MGILKEYLETIKTNLGIEALKVDLKKLTEVEVPQELVYGIPVLNKQGYVRITTNEYTDSFIDTSSKADKPVLEIGCAYGHISQRVLEAGGRIVACDLGEEHLEILLRQTPKEYLKNLHVYPARFPNEVDFPENSFTAIMASRVLHFLDGNSLEKGFEKIYNWLTPNGKFYFISLSIYKSYLEKLYLPQYRKNIANGIKWAGEIENQLLSVPHHEEFAPKFIHVFDVPQLEEILPEFGFKIEKIGLFDYPDDRISDNKGHIGFIAKKI